MSAPATDTATALAARLDSVLGGRVLRLRRSPGGTSRLFWTLDLERDGVVQPLAMLQDNGRGPWFGTRFNMRREGRMLAALKAAGAPVAGTYYVADDSSLMVMDRLPGRGDFSFTDDALRLATIDSFARSLAALHAIDARAAGLPIAVPATRREGTLADVADYEEAYLRMCIRHDLVDDAFGWVKTHVPEGREPPSVVQGDTGPTNFMHQDGKLTGFIDWEMGHVGDPHDDLAWIWFRTSMLNFDVSPTPWFAAYARATGSRLDERKLLYFSVLIILRCTVANLVRQANEPGSSDERAARTRAMLASALSDAAGREDRILPPLGVPEGLLDPGKIT